MKIIITPHASKCVRHTLLAAAAAIVLPGLSACNSGGGYPATSADFDGEVYSHKFWSQLSPIETSVKQQTGTSSPYEEIVDTDVYRCSNDIYSMTGTPKDFVAIDPDASVMWLGNLIQGDSHLQVGALQELSIRQRAPLSISIDLLRGNNFRIVQQPSLITVNAAIGELVEDAVAAGHEASSDVYFESMEAHSAEQTSLDLGFSAEYLGSRAEASLSVDKQGEENSFYAYFMQNAFTVSIVLPAAPHDLVSDEFTQAQLDQLKAHGDIGEDNPPLYLSSVSYGRVLIYKMTSSHSRQRIEAAISASYHGMSGGGGGYSEIELQQTLSSARIEISAFGGNQASIEALIRSGQLRDYFTGDTRLSSMRPISFEIRNLQDNSIADISRTTEYNVKHCSYMGKTTPAIGERVRLVLDSVRIRSDCDSGIDKGDMFGRFDVISYDNDNQSRITRRIRTISRNSPIKVQSNNDLALGNDIEIDKFYGRPFEISAQLKDKDGGANGADDLVGNWNANQFSIATRTPGSYSKTAVGNCSGNNPVLYYRLERLGYIY